MRGSRRAGDVYLALMRGINLAGRNTVPMKDLAAMFVRVGCADVVTYIQRGNVVFRTSEATASCIPAVIAKTISQRLGFRVPVVLRTAAELRAVARSNPFLRASAAPEALHVMFLADRPPP